MLIPMTPTQADHAIAACEPIETGLRTAATNAQQAIQEIAREFKRMVDMINADRAGRGFRHWTSRSRSPESTDD